MVNIIGKNINRLIKDFVILIARLGKKFSFQEFPRIKDIYKKNRKKTEEGKEISTVRAE